MWACLWATWSSWRCLWSLQGVGLDGPLKSFPTWTVWWLYDSKWVSYPQYPQHLDHHKGSGYLLSPPPSPPMLLLPKARESCSVSAINITQNPKILVCNFKSCFTDTWVYTHLTVKYQCLKSKTQDWTISLPSQACLYLVCRRENVCWERNCKTKELQLGLDLGSIKGGEKFLHNYRTTEMLIWHAFSIFILYISIPVKDSGFFFPLITASNCTMKIWKPGVSHINLI